MGENIKAVYAAGVNNANNADELTGWALALENVNVTGNSDEAAVVYKAAKGAFSVKDPRDAYNVADQHFGELLEKAGTKNPEELASRLTQEPIAVSDIVKVVTQDLLGMSSGATAALLSRMPNSKTAKESLKGLVAKVYQEDPDHREALNELIDSWHFTGAKSLGRAGRKALLKLGELRNVTWRATKIAGAIREQDFASIDPEKTSDAHTLREHIWGVYTRHLEKTGDSDEAALLAALEFGLDVRKAPMDRKAAVPALGAMVL